LVLFTELSAMHLCIYCFKLFTIRVETFQKLSMGS